MTHSISWQPFHCNSISSNSETMIERLQRTRKQQRSQNRICYPHNTHTHYTHTHRAPESFIHLCVQSWTFSNLTCDWLSLHHTITCYQSTCSPVESFVATIPNLSEACRCHQNHKKLRNQHSLLVWTWNTSSVYSIWLDVGKDTSKTFRGFFNS